MKKSIIAWIFWIYIVLLFLLVVVKYDGSMASIIDRMDSYKLSRMNGLWNLNLVPLRTITGQLKYIRQGWALKNILGNMILFVPFGIILPAAYEGCRQFWKTLSIGLASIVAIEIFQFITLLGSFDVDDIILNTIGLIIGYLMFFIYHKWTSQLQL
ncbi:VanZ family protein [Clostridia bacterium]|nr:VanZ family protein [Clostridia bacterium]